MESPYPINPAGFTMHSGFTPRAMTPRAYCTPVSMC